jgi:hypothetical protein
MAASRTPAFRGRARERKALDGVLDRVRGGESAVLVIRGEAGIGKTALMRYCARQASGCRLVHVDGVESEMELPLAALHLDERVCDRIVAETGGNPLGLLELASGMSEAELAGGFADPPKASLPGHLQAGLRDHYLRRVQVLPGPAQQLMLLAAADPTGDATLLWRAAQTLGLGPDAVVAADAEQLLQIGSQVRFRHPLVRAAAYTAGSPEDRRAAHLLQRARVEQLRGQVEWASVTLAGPLAGPGGLLLEVSRAAQAAPRPAGAPRPRDLLLDGLTTMIAQGRAAAESAMRRAVAAFLGDQVSREDRLQWGILAQMATMGVWDFDSWVALSTRDVDSPAPRVPSPRCPSP